MRRLLRQSLGTFAGHGFVLGAGLLTSVLLNRALGPGLKGVFISCLLIPQTAVVLAELGLGTAGAYWLVRRKHQPGMVIWLLILASLLLGGLAAAVTWLLLSGLPAQTWGGIDRMVVLSLIPPGLWLTFVPEIFLGLGWLAGYNWWRSGYQAFRLLVLAGLLWLMSDKLQAAIWGSVLLNWAAFLASLAILRRYLRPVRVLPRGELPGFLKFGSRVFAGEVLGFLHYRADILMIALWLDQFQVGLYATAAFLSELLWMIPRGVYAPVFARIAGAGMERNDIRQASIITLGVTGAAALATALLVGPAIGWLYGLPFAGAVWPFILLLPGTVLLSLPKFLEAPLIAELGAPQVLVWSKGAGLAANVGLNILLIPRYGISGAAVASSLSYSLQAGLFLGLFAGRYQGLRPAVAREGDLLAGHESGMNELAD